MGRTYESVNILHEASGFKAGTIQYNDYGACIATWKVSKQRDVGEMSLHGVLNVGPIQVGIRTYFVGVIPGRKDIFLGANGKVWRYPRRRLKVRVPPPPQPPLKRWTRHCAVWANTLRTCCIDRMDMMPEHKLGDEGRRRYTALVRSLVFRCILDSGSFGINRTPLELARSVSPHWTEWDLLEVVVPTTRHALYVSLLLALKEDEAAGLIELASFCEYRCTVITRHAATTMYVGAAQQLARLCPAWWTSGYATEWKLYGSIEQCMRRQFMRIVKEAADIDGVEYDVAGVDVQAVVKAALSSSGVEHQVSQRTLDRNERSRAYAAASHIKDTKERMAAQAAADEAHPSVRYGTDTPDGRPTVRSAATGDGPY